MHWTLPHHERNHLLAERSDLLPDGVGRIARSVFLILVFSFVVFLPVKAAWPSHPADSDAGRKVGGAVVDYVDRIEINHVVDSTGLVTLDQIIYWDYSTSLSTYVVVDWRSLKTFSQVPYKSGLLYVSQFHDSRDTCWRRVVCGDVCETFTTYDPEAVNQEICDRNFRRGLTRPEKQTVRRK